MSAASDDASSSLSTRYAMLDAIAEGQAATVGNHLRECAATCCWPLSRAGLLFAAVKLGRASIAAQLLQAGTPSQFIAAELPYADRLALDAAGISTLGLSHLSPLALAVCQLDLEMTRLLLSSGAQAAERIGGLPLLLIFFEAAAASTAAAMHDSSDSSGSGGSGTSRSSGGSGGSGSSRSSGGSGGSSSSSSRPGGIEAFVKGLNHALCLLSLLLHSGADPLQPTLDKSSNFLTVCNQPAMLRLTVNFVRRQCECGRQLTDNEAQQLVAAGARAFLAGF